MVACTLALFDIEPAKDEAGNEIPIHYDYTDGLVRWVSCATFEWIRFSGQCPDWEYPTVIRCLSSVPYVRGTRRPRNLFRSSKQYMMRMVVRYYECLSLRSPKYHVGVKVFDQ